MMRVINSNNLKGMHFREMFFSEDNLYYSVNALKALGSISQRVRTGPNLELVLGDIQIAWVVLS